MSETDNRLAQQLRFVVEIDRLKTVLRQTLLTDASRQENSAEHSWHLALMAALLAEHAGAEVDVTRTMKMVLVHDVVEIDAGDAFCYDAAANVGKEERERLAAERIFGLLPAEQAAELHALWVEFEAGETAEARFAVALDRLQPLLPRQAQSLLQSAGGRQVPAHPVRTRSVIRHAADSSCLPACSP